jgi:phage tail tape-measure protein
MSNLRTSVTLDLIGNLEARSQRYAASLNSMAQRGSRSLNMLKGAAANVGRGLDALGNRYTALLSGAAGAGTARQVINLQSRFTRLEIQAGATEERMAALRDRIYEAAQAPDIRVDPGEITAAIEAIVERTGDLDFAEANIRNIGLAIQATGAAGQDIGGLMSEFQKQGIDSSDAVLEALATLTAQGKMGAFTLQNLAALGPRVVTAYTAMGRSGPEAMREMGAALQMIMMGTGEAANAATAFEATLRTLADPAKLKKLEGAGLQIFDPEKLKQGQRVLRPINELMAEIIQKTGGDKVKLGMIFDQESARAFNQANAEFMKRGSLDSLDKFFAVQDDGTGLMADSARAAKDAAAALTSLTTAWEKFTSKLLTGPIQDVANALNALGAEGTDTLMSTLAYGGVALGGAVMLRKAYTGGRGLVDMFRGGKGGGAGLGGLGGLGGMKLPLPVYVVNSKMSLMPGEMGGGAEFGGGSGRRSSRLGRALSSRGGRLGRGLARSGKWLGRAGGALALAGSAYDLYDTWSNSDGSTADKVQATGGAVGGGLGGWGGAAAGAALGTMILPGIGTAIGAALGGLGGSAAGAWLGDAVGGLVGDWFKDDAPSKSEPTKAEASLDIRVTDERVAVRQVKANGYASVDVDSGPYMMGVGQ